MTRNVARSFNRHYALALWRSPSAEPIFRRGYSKEPEQTPSVATPSDKEQIQQLLIVADQQYLRECKSQANEFIDHIKNATDTVQAIPLTVQADPKSRIPPYQLGLPRTLFQSPVPERAKRTIEAAQTVKEHLTDLQFEPYKDKAENPLVKFEKEIEAEGWTREKKESQSKEWEFELEAKLARLKRDARTLNEDYQNELSGMRNSSAAPSFQPVMGESSEETDRGQREFKDARRDRRPSSKARDAEKADSTDTPPPPVSDLKTLQNQLAASYNQSPR